MSDRAEDLRREAARCLEQANATADPRRREQLITMATRFYELATSVQADFDSILRAFNEAQMAPPDAASKPVVQQQQQVQPKKDGESGN
jgi:hypothetical protein